MFTEDELLDAAGERVYDRGLDYVGYVHGLQLRDGEARASIQARNVYTVQLRWSARGVDGDCSCPHNAEGTFCKHLVAVGLAALDSIATPSVGDPERDAIRDYLARLGHETLLDLAEELAFTDRATLRLVQTRAVVADAAAIDPAALIVLVNDAMPRGFVDYRRSFDAAREVNDALGEVEQLLDPGAGSQTRPALERALTRMRRVLLNADDSAGVLGDACQRAAELHARACCASTPLTDVDARKLGRWLARFRFDSPGWPKVTLAMYTPALGESGVTAYRSAVDKLGGASGDSSYELDRIRLELADHYGDVDEAVRLLAAGTYGPRYAEIVDRLTAAGRSDDALMWLDRAVAAGKLARPWQRDHNPVWISPDDAVQRYLAADRGADALAVARTAFRTDISPASLALLDQTAQRLGALEAEHAWAVQIAEAEAARRQDGSALVQLALAENDLVAAWSATGRHGAGASWRQLADASAADLPVAAADLYRPELDRLLQYADTSNYAEVVKILQTMRSLYAKVDEAATIDGLVGEIRERYRRRTSLIARLDKAGLRG